ncbi:MAG: 2-oxo acid dehydrogenase subunit E2 [Bacteroidia bacterium]
MQKDSAISTEARHFAGLARSKKLQPQDWKEIIPTVSNLGMYGIEEFTAIINPPDACILLIINMKNPRKRTGSTRTCTKVTLSCDHRVVDGATDLNSW